MDIEIHVNYYSVSAHTHQLNSCRQQTLVYSDTKHPINNNRHLHDNRPAQARGISVNLSVNFNYDRELGLYIEKSA